MDDHVETTPAKSATQEKSDSSELPPDDIASSPKSLGPAKNNQQDTAASQTQASGGMTPRQQIRQTKLLTSLLTTKSNLTTTESLLAAKIQQIQQLPSFQAANSSIHDQNKAALAHAQSITNKHISLLRRYNEIKDIALGMLGLVAEKEGKRLAEVMEERGISEKGE